MGQEQVIKNLKMQLLVERAVITVVLLVFLGRWMAGYFGKAPFAIVVNNQPIAYLETTDSAEKVLSAVKRNKAGTVENVQFVQNVSVERRRGGGPVIAESKAIEIANKKLRVRMEKWVIMSDGKPAVAVDSQEMAGTVLETLKAKFGQRVKNLLEEPQFKENVKVELTQVDEALYRRTVDEAVQQILHPKSPSDDNDSNEVREYIVKDGDIAANIAKRQGISLEELEKLNPGRNLAKLQIGDKLRISGKPAQSSDGDAKITVIVRDMTDEVQQIPYETQTISSTNMYQGKQLTTQPGRNGLRSVKMAVTYENGVRKNSEIVEEQVIREPVPRRVVIGIRPR